MCEKPPFQPRFWFFLKSPYTCHFEQDEFECWSELLPLKGCPPCGQHSRCNICKFTYKMAQHHKICKLLSKWEDPKHSSLQWEFEWIIHNNFIVTTRVDKLVASVIMTMKVTQTSIISKPNSNSFLMLVVFTLHQTWSSYFQSIPCIWSKCFIGWCRGKSSNKMSFLKFIERKTTFYM